jgi:hypothetical protein
MKKLLVFFILCLLTAVALAMREKRAEPEGGLAGDESTIALKRRERQPEDIVDECVNIIVQGRKLPPEKQKALNLVIAAARARRAKLTWPEQQNLDAELLVKLQFPSRPDFSTIKRLLEFGASSCDSDCLSFAAQSEGCSLVALLLLYGAAPRSERNALTGCGCVESARLLRSYGADIAEAGRRGIVHLFSERDLDILVWFLEQDINPNGARDIIGFSVIQAAVCDRNLCSVIALLQHGAQFDVQTDEGKSLLSFVELIYSIDQREFPEQLQFSCAIYELFKTLIALKERESLATFDLREVYPLEKYTSLGISEESAKLIRETTIRVLEAKTKIGFGDLTYDCGNATKFLHDRELGRGHKK